MGQLALHIANASTGLCWSHQTLDHTTDVSQTAYLELLNVGSISAHLAPVVLGRKHACLVFQDKDKQATPSSNELTEEQAGASGVKDWLIEADLRSAAVLVEVDVDATYEHHLERVQTLERTMSEIAFDTSEYTTGVRAIRVNYAIEEGWNDFPVELERCGDSAVFHSVDKNLPIAFVNLSGCDVIVNQTALSPEINSAAKRCGDIRFGDSELANGNAASLLVWC